jgi:hypothetical protein
MSCHGVCQGVDRHRPLLLLLLYRMVSVRCRALGPSRLSEASALASAEIAHALQPSPPPWFCVDPDPSYKLVNVAEDTDEFISVVDIFCNNGFRTTVERIQRVQNTNLWKDYQLECMKIRGKVRYCIGL